MSPHSRSRSASARRSVSPVRRNGRRKSHSRHSRDHLCLQRSRSNSRHPPSPPPLPPGRNGRYSGNSHSSSRSLSPRHRRRTSKSRSRSRSRSRSPYYKRSGTREKPLQSRCIGVFGLSVYTTQQQIREIFSKFGPIERIQVVIDAQTGRSRGFCFIYYEDMADAKVAKVACCGMEIDDRRIRVDYSITQRPHTPTPGVYMGRSTGKYRMREREFHDRYRDEYRTRRRSNSHGRSSYHRSERKRRERSRSRSYSPRRTRY